MNVVVGKSIYCNMNRASKHIQTINPCHMTKMEVRGNGIPPVSISFEGSVVSLSKLVVSTKDLMGTSYNSTNWIWGSRSEHENSKRARTAVGQKTSCPRIKTSASLSTKHALLQLYISLIAHATNVWCGSFTAKAFLYFTILTSYKVFIP